VRKKFKQSKRASDTKKRTNEGEFSSGRQDKSLICFSTGHWDRTGSDAFIEKSWTVPRPRRLLPQVFKILQLEGENLEILE
jgi:hypothetical protein